MELISLRGPAIDKAKFVQLVAQEKNVSNPHVHKYALIHKIKLINGTTSYPVKLNEKGTPLPGERKLKEGEMFFPTHQVYYYAKEMNDENAVQNNGNLPFFSYPDANYFNGANEASSLALLTGMGSSFSLRIKGKDAWKAMPGHFMLYRPLGQYATPAGNGEASASLQQFGCDPCGKGYFELHNDVALRYEDENLLIIDLAKGDSMNITGSDNTVLPDSHNVLYILQCGYLYYGTNNQEQGFCAVAS